MNHLDLFSGIGGFALATEMVWKNVEHSFVEIDPFCQAVLRKHWPNAHIHDDIKTYRGGSEPVDLVTGGFPCQPFSNAGKRKGTADDRNLWPEMFRIIREVRPRWVIGENVDGLITWGGGLVLEGILSDLESAGYGAQSFIIPAAGIQAPHRRDRLWVVAHADGLGRIHGQAEKLATKRGKYALGESLASSSYVPDTSSGRREGRAVSVRPGGPFETARDTHRRGETMADPDRLDGKRSDTQASQEWQEAGRPTGLCSSAGTRIAEWPIEPDVGRVANGVPHRVDRIKSLGNAIVPQVATEIMRAIRTADSI